MKKRNKLIIAIIAVLVGIVLKITSKYITPPLSFTIEIIAIVLLMGGIVLWMMVTFKTLLAKK